MPNGVTHPRFVYDYRLKSESDTLFDNPSFPISTQTDYEYDANTLIKVISESANEGGIRKQTYKRIRKSSCGVCASNGTNHILLRLSKKRNILISDDEATATETGEI